MIFANPVANFVSGIGIGAVIGGAGVYVYNRISGTKSNIGKNASRKPKHKKVKRTSKPNVASGQKA